MFDLGANKIFMDSVHGYISVPKLFVEKIVDTEYFQRLRNIDQTGIRILYPNAKHDRFCHSLGVFYLGQKAVDSLLDKFYLNEHWNLFDKSNTEKFWLKNKILFLLACLLHDIGHTPFSHSLESQVLDNTFIKEKVGKNYKRISVTDKLKTYIVLNEKKFHEKNYKDEEFSEDGLEIHAAAHEQLGALLIIKKFSEIIGSIIKKLMNTNDQLNVISDEEISDDICFILRMIMGIKYESWHIDRQIRNCFIELLNGENFDVDKLDYIIRDTHMSGISNVAVDVERLIGSLCIVTKTKQFNKNLMGKQITHLTATLLKNKSGDKLSIKGNIYGAIKISKNAIVNIFASSKIEALNGEKHDNAKIAYISGDHAVFDNNSYIVTANGKIPAETMEGYGEVKQLSGETTGTYFYVSIEKAKVLKSFKFKVGEAVEVNFAGYCEIQIAGEFQTIGPIKISEITDLSGNISQLELMGDAFKEEFTTKKKPSPEGYNTFSIGFKKQAINCIASVLDARNYLYLWVYAHHKVIYYANFLIPVISKEISNEITKNANKVQFPNWNLNYDNLDKLDDPYIWTAVKFLNAQKSVKGDMKELYTQLFSRKYYTSMYKSLAEFETMFDFDWEKINLIFDKLIKLINKRGLCIKEQVDGKEICTTGYLRDNTIEKINLSIADYIEERGLVETYGDVRIEKIIFVHVNYKLKTLKAENVYIDMGYNEVIPISLIPLFGKESVKSSKDSGKYFYLYYKCNSTIEDKVVNYIIRNAVKNFLNAL